MTDMEPEKVTMYHYTSKKGAKGIKKSGVIRQSSKSANPRDALFGDGVYLTGIKPDTGKFHIAVNNYDDGGVFVDSALKEGKVDRVIKMILPKSWVEKAPGTKRDVYKHDGDLNLKDVDYQIEKVKN